jgi:hypothetical protein
MATDLPAWEAIPLPMDIPAQPAPQRPPRARPVAWGACPHCIARAREGLLRQGRHLIWRPHRYRTWAGTDMDCPAGGVPACQAQPRKGYLINVDAEKTHRTQCTCLVVFG